MVLSLKNFDVIKSIATILAHALPGLIFLWRGFSPVKAVDSKTNYDYEEDKGENR